MNATEQLVRLGLGTDESSRTCPTYKAPVALNPDLSGRGGMSIAMPNPHTLKAPAGRHVYRIDVKGNQHISTNSPSPTRRVGRTIGIHGNPRRRCLSRLS